MKNNYYFGIDVGATFTKLALVRYPYRIMAKDVISSSRFSDKAQFAENISGVFKGFLEVADINERQVKAVGIGLPGPVDFKRGRVVDLTNIKGWKNFLLSKFLKKTFSAPVFIENDANCMCLAESRLGAARGYSQALCLTLGTGVGGGLIIDNKILRTPFFCAGEIGHVPVAVKGPKCTCGGVACLERFVGNRAISSLAKKRFSKNISLEEVSRLARKGNSKARNIWKEVGEQIGFAVSGTVNVFNPEVIVVGGGVSGAGDILLGSIESTIKKYAMTPLKGHIKVKRACLGTDAGVLGAAIMAKESIEDIN